MLTQDLVSSYTGYMESLAALVALIVSPAMFGGPLVLALSFWKPESASKFRRLFIATIGSLSSLTGLFLIFGHISRGALLIGLVGLISGALSIWRVKIAFGPSRS